MSKSKEVAIVENGALQEMPDFLKNQGPARGSEDVGTEDLTIPRLELTQALSKCRKKSDSAYIEGIDEGDMYNSLTRENLGKEVLLVPVMFRKEFLVWRDQDLGGGFAGSYPSRQEAQEVIDVQEKPEEWDAVETAQHYCLQVGPDGALSEIVVPMAKTRSKVSRNWNSLIRLNGGDRFSRIYKVMAVEETNAKNQDYQNMAVFNHGFVTEPIYRAAEALYEDVAAGNVSADYSDELAGSTGDTSQESEF